MDDNKDKILEHNLIIKDYLENRRHATIDKITVYCINVILFFTIAWLMLHIYSPNEIDEEEFILNQ